MISLDNKQQGFTLIEVLIASLILVLSLLTAMNIYQGALANSQSATHTLHFQRHIMPLKTLITQSIRQSSPLNTIQQQLVYADIDVSWQARPVATGLPFHPDNSPLETVVVTNQNNPQGATPVHLWRVDVQLTYHKKQRAYSFWELSW